MCAVKTTNKCPRNTKASVRPKSWRLDVGNPDVNESDVRMQDEEVLRLLILDRTMSGVNGRPTNIKWATDDYADLGFSFETEMTIDQISSADGTDIHVVMPRFAKRQDAQRKRSVERAEVFTPSWVCNEQNNLVDAAWFCRKTSPFNLPRENAQTKLKWTSTRAPEGIVKFPTKLKKTWQDYVLAKRLEVSCGEAPYLTSRYDTTDGRWIDPDERIGLLDRKLRVVGENCAMKEPAVWIEWAKKAVQSVYGFEWQGDNILLARENLLYTVIEAFEADYPKFHLPVTVVREFAEIISWNIWQMDGIKFVVPKSCEQKKDLMGNQEDCPGCRKNSWNSHIGIRCKIKDWQTGEIEDFIPPKASLSEEKGAN